MKRLYIVTLLLLAGLVLTGVTVAQDEKVLVIGHAEATDFLDPAYGYNQTTGIINHVTYETLVTFPSDSAAEILPLLATDWTIAEDGLSYTFNLNPDAVFASGNPVTADDVVFSVNRLKNIGGAPAFLTGAIESVTADDADTVTFTLNGPSPAFLANLTNNAFGVTEAAVVTENGGTDAEDAATTDTAQEYLDSTSAGSGPYVLESWEPTVETVLVRNENYWGEAPYFDRIIISNIPEAATQKAALESGEIDIALDLTADQMPDFEGNADISVFNGPGNIVHFILMNENEEQCGPTADPNVQQAIRLALDYSGYVDLWGGINPASVSAFGIFAALPPEDALTRDLDTARQLLADAGYADGVEITLDYPIFTFQGVNMETNAQKIQADLAEVGINVTLNGGDLQTQLETYRNGQECLGYWFWGPDVLDPFDMLSFLPGAPVADNRALWTEDRADEEILGLRDQGRVETDPATREQVFGDIQRYLQANGPWAPFLQPNVQTAFRSDIQGYVWHPQWLIDVALLSRAEA